ncbi:hypothetical protein [Nonomuraea sp. NPDC046570]|uniref:hypothetical protein n=1 Tax=Nonomuraea sp. NPDC046570 TaxID=3155255 RepID=UPI0033DEC558
MHTRTFVGADITVGFALTMLTGPVAQAAPAPATPAAASAAEAGDTAVMVARTSSIKCGKGLGGSRKVNFSWAKGNATTKIYFNNQRPHA